MPPTGSDATDRHLFFGRRAHSGNTFSPRTSERVQVRIRDCRRVYATAGAQRRLLVRKRNYWCVKGTLGTYTRSSEGCAQPSRDWWRRNVSLGRRLSDWWRRLDLPLPPITMAVRPSAVRGSPSRSKSSLSLGCCPPPCQSADLRPKRKLTPVRQEAAPRLENITVRLANQAIILTTLPVHD